MNMQMHAEGDHIPGVMALDLDPGHEEVTRLVLWQLARWLLPQHQSVVGLVNLLNLQSEEEGPGRRVGREWEAPMRALCVALGVQDAIEFRVDPLNSPGALIHWMSMLALMSMLSERQCWHLAEFGPPEGVRRVPAPMLAFDAHFHVDRLCQRLRCVGWMMMRSGGGDPP